MIAMMIARPTTMINGRPPSERAVSSRPRLRGSVDEALPPAGEWSRETLLALPERKRSQMDPEIDPPEDRRDNGRCDDRRTPRAPELPRGDRKRHQHERFLDEAQCCKQAHSPALAPLYVSDEPE